MKTPRFLFLAAVLLLTGCQHPDGRAQAQAAQGDLGRTSSAITAADAANAQAQADTADVRHLDQRIDDKTVILENSR